MATKKNIICFEYTCWIFSGVVELFVCVEGPLRFFLGNIFSPASFFMVGLAVQSGLPQQSSSPYQLFQRRVPRDMLHWLATYSLTIPLLQMLQILQISYTSLLICLPASWGRKGQNHWSHHLGLLYNGYFSSKTEFLI